MEGNPLISIIVPVYNSNAYLHKCIESILQQSFTDFELILVDDGSTDESGQICENFKEIDNRIKVIHKKNGGVSEARKTGLNHSSGKYICFIDSDDSIDIDYLHKLHSGLKDNCQIVCVRDRFEKITGKDYLQGLLAYNFGWEMWNKLFRRDILNPNFFSLPKSLSIGEDIVANLQIAQKASFVSIIPYAGYHYIINPNSAMHKRKVSYESKTLFFSEIDRVLGDLFNDYIQEIWHLRMKYVRSLVSNNVTIPKDSTWYNWLKENAKIINYKNINEKLLLSGLSYSMKRHVIHMIDRIHYIKMKSKGGNYI